MKSKYVRESTSNDLETFGHIDTTCETVQEFIEDIVQSKRLYQFVFQKHTKVFDYPIKECVAKLVVNDGIQKRDTGVYAIRNERIERIEYHDGWGGVEFWVTLKGGKE